MKTMKIWRLAFVMLAAFSLVTCSSDDDDKDITKEIIMNVSAEPGGHSSFLFKNIQTESEMAHVQQSMPQGETLRYALVLCNVYKRAIQKVEFTIKKK